MTENTRKIAVLTGDIVGSTALGAEKLERAMAALAECAEVQADWHGESLRFTRNRGDGWQVVLARPEMALRSALAFRAALRAEGSEFDSYLAIAVADTHIAIADDLNAETGAAFVHSGAHLDWMKTEAGTPRIFIYPETSATAAAILADHVSQNWTPPQANAMRIMLAPNDQTSYTDVARLLGKSRQAVTKSLEAAGQEPILMALGIIEDEIANV